MQNQRILDLLKTVDESKDEVAAKAANEELSKVTHEDLKALFRFLNEENKKLRLRLKELKEQYETRMEAKKNSENNPAA